MGVLIWGFCMEILIWGFCMYILLGILVGDSVGDFEWRF